MNVYKEFRCLDCKVDTMNDEYYMVHNPLWISAVGIHRRGMLCIGCLERCIGRQLTVNDFTSAPVNHRGVFPQSARLMHRLGMAEVTSV